MESGRPSLVSFDECNDLKVLWCAGFSDSVEESSNLGFKGLVFVQAVPRAVDGNDKSALEGQLFDII